MKVVDERQKETVLFKDLLVGDLFYEVPVTDDDDGLLMVTEIVTSADGDKYNCICVENGWGWLCKDDTKVEKVRGKLVLY